MIGSFREWLGRRLGGHRHHGRAPVASWFQVERAKGSSSWLRLCLDCRDVSGMINRLVSQKLLSPSVSVVASCWEPVASVQPCMVPQAYSNSSFPGQKATAHTMTLPVSSLIQNCNTRNGTIYVICPHSKVYII